MVDAENEIELFDYWRLYFLDRLFEHDQYLQDIYNNLDNIYNILDSVRDDIFELQFQSAELRNDVDNLQVQASITNV